MVPVQFHKYFWDSDVSTLDPKIHQRYILERLLEFGNEEAAAWLRANFSESEIKAVLSHQRSLSPKSVNYWQFVLRQQL